MKYTIKDDDLLDLWKYFEDKAISVKGAMFNTTTWIIGFAAALLGFIFVNLTNYDQEKAVIPLSFLITLSSITGLIICSYAFVSIHESIKHISKNWKRANICLDQIDGLKDIISPDSENYKKNWFQIWNQLQIIVFIFTAAFFGLLVWSSAVCIGK